MVVVSLVMGLLRMGSVTVAVYRRSFVIIVLLENCGVISSTVSPVLSLSRGSRGSILLSNQNQLMLYKELDYSRELERMSDDSADWETAGLAWKCKKLAYAPSRNSSLER